MGEGPEQSRTRQREKRGCGTATTKALADPTDPIELF